MKAMTLLLCGGAALFAITNAGCIAVVDRGWDPEPIPAPPSRALVYDYRHRNLKDIDEDERIEHVIQSHGNELEAAEKRRQARKVWPRRTHVVRHVRHYRPRYYGPGPRTYYYYDGYYHHRHRPLGIGSTLLFGTLGGVIGHQSGHRDEGILIGAGYGLFRDLFQW